MVNERRCYLCGAGFKPLPLQQMEFAPVCLTCRWVHFGEWNVAAADAQQAEINAAWATP